MLALLLIFMLLITVICSSLNKKTVGLSADGDTKNVEIMVPLKNLIIV